MKHVSIHPGAYVTPIGSDLLWWLMQHFTKTLISERIILLPTQRSANRLTGLLRKTPELLKHTDVRTYDRIYDLETSEREFSTQDQLWRLVEDDPLMERLFKVGSPNYQQKSKLIRSVRSMLSELSFYGISIPQLKEKLDQKLSPQLYALITTMERYGVIWDEQAIQLTQQCERWIAEMDSVSQSVYLVMDGLVPPPIQNLAKALSQRHIVLASGEFTSQQVSDLTFQSLPVYVPRKMLLTQLQTDVPTAKEVERDVEGVQCIESPTIVHLAKQIVQSAQAKFNDGEKVVTLVTGNRQLSEFVTHFCQFQAISVDDSFGVTLDKTAYAIMILKGLSWLESPKDYKRLLTFVSLPEFRDYWSDVPAKIDYWGRLKQFSFKETLQHFPSENDQEKQKIRELITLYDRDVISNFRDQVEEVQHYLSSWSLLAEEGSSAFEQVKNLVDVSQTLDQLKFYLQSATLRPRTPSPPYLQILGPLEARLLNPKNVIVADLNEGEWPSRESGSVWLNSTLRMDLGLPEQKTFLEASSHALLSLMGGRHVVFGRTTSEEGELKIASRWWKRLNVILKLNGVDLPLVAEPTDQWKAQDAKGEVKYKIPESLRPTKLSVSDIHLWINEPGRFVKERLFGFNPLLAWETEADYLQKGIWMHEVLEQIVRQNLDKAAAYELALKKLKTLNVSPSDRIFWEVESDRYLGHYFSLRQSIQPVRTWVEVRGAWKLETRFGPIEIIGKADRIDQMKDGSLLIIDYKTGSLPLKKSVREGKYPQLLLLGLMLKHGAFEVIKESKYPFMVGYWGLKSGESQNHVFDELVPLESWLVQQVESLLDPETIVEIND